MVKMKAAFKKPTTCFSDLHHLPHFCPQLLFQLSIYTFLFDKKRFDQENFNATNKGHNCPSADRSSQNKPNELKENKKILKGFSSGALSSFQTRRASK